MDYISTRFYIVTGILVVSITLFIVGVFFTLNSLWLMWELLPPERELAVAIKRNSAVDTYIKEYGDIVDVNWSYYPFSTRMAYSRYSDGETLVVLPQLKYQLTLKEAMERDGWDTRRVGMMLKADRGGLSSAEVEIITVLRKYFSGIADFIVPRSPLFIADLKENSLPYIDKNIFGIGQLKAGVITMTFSFNGFPISSIDNEMDLDLISTEEMYIFVPSYVIAMLSEEIKEGWNGMLRKEIGISYTQPRITDYLEKGEYSLIGYNGQAVNFGIEGNTESFIEAVSTLIAEEETYLRPVTKAFRLPDGTLGYEKVPGELRQVVENDSEPNCSVTKDMEIRLWLCVKNNKAVVSTDRSASLMMLNKAWNTSWEIIIGEKAMQSLKLDDIGAMQGKGTGEFAIIKIDLKDY